MTMLRLFLSYSRTDESLANSLSKVIKDNLGDGVHIFKDTPYEGSVDASISVGSWIETIQAEIQKADIVLGIVSKDFIESRWLYMELGGGVLFGKEVIPICVPPISRELLCNPIDTKQAFVFHQGDIVRLIKYFQNRINMHESSPVDVQLESESSDDDDFKDAERILQSRNSVSQVVNLLTQTNAIGSTLWNIHSSYRGEVRLNSEVTCDENGNCRIVRAEEIRPFTPMLHTYYHISIDKPGSIEITSAKMNVTGDPLSILERLRSDVLLHVSILFNEIVLQDVPVSYTLDIRAENYLSDLIDTGIGQVTYRNIRSVPAKSHLQIFRFPRTSTFRDMRVLIADTSDVQKIGNEVPAEFTDDHIVFRVNLNSIVENVGTDLIEFRLR